VAEPGVIKHFSGDRFTLGEPDGSDTERLRVLSELLIAGGLKAPRKARLRDEIWIKLWGNCSFNPVSALTGATSISSARTTPLCLVYKMMADARRSGICRARFSVDIPRRIKGGTDTVGHKPSTRHEWNWGAYGDRSLFLPSSNWQADEYSDTQSDAVAALLRMQPGSRSL